jgi:integrase
LVKILPKDNNGSIRIRFKIGGQTHNISNLGRSDNRIASAKAELIAATIEKDIELGDFDPTLARYLSGIAINMPAKKTPAPMMLLEVWDLWVDTLALSEQTKSDHYKTTRGMIKRTKPSPSTDSAEWFLKGGAHLSPFSYNLRKRFIRSCLDWAIEQGMVSENPFRTIKSKKSAKRNKTKPLALEQVRQILAELKIDHPEYHAFSTFLFLTGCRTSEGIGIQWKRIDFDRGELTIADTLAQVNYQKELVRKQTKTGAVTTVIMSAGLENLLRSIPRGKPDDLVFPGIDGEPIARMGYYKTWRKVLAKLDIPYVKPYVSRHSFASLALDSGLDASKVASFLGHTDSSMVDKNYGSAMKPATLPTFDLGLGD